jgi:CRISPR system Cascade subunit CasC
MLIQFHLLQNYSPANLNRDDSGAPKDALFGGVRRGRVSSQCLKRSIRKSATFEAAFKAEGRLAVRTKGLPALIQGELVKLGAETKIVQAIVARVPEIGRESGKKSADDADADADAPETTAAESPAESETKQLIFLGRDELSVMAQKLLRLYQQYGDEKKWAKAKIADITKALGSSVPRSVDVALFGRMTTSEAFEDVQAAVQVAHALSVNALVEEFDYYTAVDDLSGESGAGMIGDIEFNCSTYYKYLNIHWEQLVKNLGGDVAVARRAILALVDAAATAQPTGKQNTFAAHCLPDLVLVEVRDKNLPVNYANAFLKPARVGSGQTVMDDAIAKLGEYMARVGKAYGLTADRRAFLALQEANLPGAAATPSLADLQDWVAKQLPEG